MSEPTPPSEQEIHDLANNATLTPPEKNRAITAMYHRLSHSIQPLLKASADVNAPADLDWCGFAKWSSKTVGSDLDPELTGVRVENLVNKLPPLPPLLAFLKDDVRDILNSLRDQPLVIGALRLGNDVIFDEMGTVFVRMIERLSGPPQPPETDAEFANDVVTRVKQLKHPSRDGRSLVDHLVERDEDTTEKLRKGIRFYLRAAREPANAAELILAGSMLFSSYEQTRADQLIAIGICGPARAAVHTRFPIFFPDISISERDLVLAGRPHPNFIMRELDAIMAPFLTKNALAVVIGHLTVHLGSPEDLPSPSVIPTLPETKEVLDPLEQLPPDDGTRDWTDLGYRLRVIRHYFAALQRDREAQNDPLDPGVT